MNNPTQFTFQVIVDFKITVTEAAALLAENDGTPSVSEWLSKHTPEDEIMDTFNARALKEALGKHLAESKVQEARQLCMSAGSQPSPES